MNRAIEATIARIAERHGGHISHAELLSVGLTPRQIAYRVRAGLLIAVFRGVYAVGHLATNPRDEAAGALLAMDARAGMSHSSAGYLWQVQATWRVPMEVITAVDRRPRGLRVHRTALLLPRDVRIHQGLRVVSPALALLQVAPTLTERELKRAIEDLRLSRDLRISQLDDVLARFPRHPGAKHLRAVGETLQAEPTRSAWEDEWVPFAADERLPAYVMNQRFCGYRVDVRFLDPVLVVELDGWETHRSRQRFNADREQDKEILARTGVSTVRITRDQFRADRAGEAAQLHAILDRLRASQAGAARGSRPPGGLPG